MNTKHQHHFLAEASSLNLSHTRKVMREVDGANAKVAVFITNLLGSMWTAYLLLLLSAVSLPAVLYAAHVIGKPGFMASEGLILIVSWIAQTCIQLVALSVLQVSNNAQAAHQEHSTDTILDRLDTDTEGGLHEVLAAIDRLQHHRSCGGHCEGVNTSDDSGQW